MRSSSISPSSSIAAAVSEASVSAASDASVSATVSSEVSATVSSVSATVSSDVSTTVSYVSADVSVVLPQAATLIAIAATTDTAKMFFITFFFISLFSFRFVRSLFDYSARGNCGNYHI